MVVDTLNGLIWLKPAFWVAVAFVIFFAVFGRRLWKELAQMLDARAAAIRGELEEAARLKREAEAMLRDATAKREAALADAKELLAAAEAEAVRIAAETRAGAAALAQRRERMALDRIAAAEKAAVTEVRNAAAELAAVAAQQVIAQGFAAEADAVIVDRAIADMPRALRAA